MYAVLYFTYIFGLTVRIYGFITYILTHCILFPLNENDEREIELLRDLGHLLREIMEMTDDEARQILDRAASNEDDQPQTM
jgi:hypothetical protein